MAASAERLRVLYNRFVTDTASPAEVEEFWALLDTLDEEDPLYEPAMPLFNDPVPQAIGGKDWSAAWQKIIAQKGEEAPVLRLRSRKYSWWIAAASILLLVLGGLWVYQRQSPKNDGTPEAVATNDIKAPASVRATLTLSDGNVVYLDAAGAGQLAAENGTHVMKTTDGRIVYQAAEPGQQLRYHTLTNPRGSQVVDIELGDGSHVWLNAGSSITYPVTFGNERRVKMSGEAYFEVQKAKDGNRNIPFYVEANGTTTEVLGTHFNVNAYEDEQVVRVTLLEGAVAVHKDELRVNIIPGEQAIAGGNQQLTTIKNVDLEQAIAWKNGLFHFRNADLETVIRQLARWYDLDVVYEGRPPVDRFEGKIPRDSKLSEVLTILEKNNVRFRIDKKKLIVFH